MRYKHSRVQAEGVCSTVHAAHLPHIFHLGLVRPHDALSWNCLLYSSPRSLHILLFQPKFGSLNPSTKLLSPVNCASIFSSVFTALVGAMCYRLNVCVPPQIHMLKPKPNVMVF